MSSSSRLGVHLLSPSVPFPTIPIRLPNRCKGNQCGSGHEHAGGSDNPIMTCTACGVKSCFVHDVPWHSGQSCDQYDKSVASDPHTLANLEYAKRHTKKCPRCSKSIEKAGGCDHMTCRRNAGGCGHEFCWR